MPKTSLWKILVTLPVALSFSLGGTGRIHGDSAAVAKGVHNSGDGAMLAQLPMRSSKVLGPDELYHKVWFLIKDEFYDQQQLSSQSWARWEHRYDNKLKNGEDAHKAIETMLGSLGDRYTRFLNKEAFDDEKGQIEAHLFGIGIQIGMDKASKVVVIAPIDDTPASRAGLMAQDEIAEIDGKATKGMTVEEAAKLIKGPKGTHVTLTINRAAKPMKFTMNRDEIHINAVQTAKMINPEVGYIRLTSFISQDANKEMLKALGNLSTAKGIVLDLRDNPGGLLTNAIEISNMFLDGRKDIVSTVDKDGYKTPARSDGHPISTQPLVILINKGSASASEIASGAMHDNGRALLVGERSFGKGLVQGITRLDDNTGVNVTIARYLTPNDTDINKKGITPDYTVDLNEKDYKEGRGPWWLDPDGPVSAAKHQPEDMKDQQLKKAVDILEDKIKGHLVVSNADDSNKPAVNKQ
jgi:carboxyl-terminal processing protease